jgi:hypothetical protein
MTDADAGAAMVFVYIVRCNFAEPAKEEAWNAWYSGAKITQMLSLPYFRTCQRFRRAGGVGRDYLALWTMVKPEAMTTPEYRAQWGFSEWTPYITDWSRDLFDGRPAGEDAFSVQPSGALQVVSFDGMTAGQASATQAEIAALQPGILWLPVIGLDRHTPLIGLKVLSGGHDRAQNALDEGIQEAIYQPLSPPHQRSVIADHDERVS